MVAARRPSDFAASAVLDGPWTGLSWLVQVEAGCAVLSDCAELAGGLPQLSPQTAFKLGTACSLVFGPGRAAIAATLAASGVWSADAQHAAAHLLPSFCDFQLATVAYLAGGLPSRQPQAAAAFANSIASPVVLLPWLDVLTRALSMLHMMRGVPSRDCHKQCVCSKANCVAWGRRYTLVHNHDVASPLSAVQASGQLAWPTAPFCCSTCSNNTTGPSTQPPLQPPQPYIKPLLGCSCSNACPLQLS